MDNEQVHDIRRTKHVVLDMDQKLEDSGGALVGRIETVKKLNIPTVIAMIKKGWQLDGDLEVHDLDRNRLIFLFRFNKSDSYARILKGRPWTIQGHLLNLQVWEEHMVLQDVDFKHTPFWVQFHGLPIEAFNGSNAKKLGDAVGEAVMFEKPMMDGKLVRSFVRVRTLINLDSPLTAGFWVPRSKKAPVWVSIKYERLQDLCYRCGRIGHDNRNCGINIELREDGKEQDFGYWMYTQAVRTLEDVVEVCKDGWLESEFLDRKFQADSPRWQSSPADGVDHAGRGISRPTGRIPDWKPRRDEVVPVVQDCNSEVVRFVRSEKAYRQTFQVQGISCAPGVMSPAIVDQRVDDGVPFLIKVNDCVSGPGSGIGLSLESISIPTQKSRAKIPTQKHMVGPVANDGPNSIASSFSQSSYIGLSLESSSIPTQKSRAEIPTQKHMVGPVAIDGPNSITSSFSQSSHIGPSLITDGFAPASPGPSLSPHLFETALAISESKLPDLMGTHRPDSAASGLFSYSAQCSMPSSSSDLDAGALVANPSIIEIDDLETNMVSSLNSDIICHNSSYSVDFPSDDEFKAKSIIPLNGLSPISAVSAGLKGIRIKRQHDDDLELDRSIKCRKLDFSSVEDLTGAKLIRCRENKERRRSYKSVKKYLRQSGNASGLSISAGGTSSVEIDFPESWLANGNNSEMDLGSPVPSNAGGWSGPTTGSP